MELGVLLEVFAALSAEMDRPPGAPAPAAPGGTPGSGKPTRLRRFFRFSQWVVLIAVVAIAIAAFLQSTTDIVQWFIDAYAASRKAICGV